MIFRYTDDDTEIALTSKGLKYKGQKKPYPNLMQLYVNSIPYYYLLLNKHYYTINNKIHYLLI